MEKFVRSLVTKRGFSSVHVLSGPLFLTDEKLSLLPQQPVDVHETSGVNNQTSIDVQNYGVDSTIGSITKDSPIIPPLLTMDTEQNNNTKDIANVERDKIVKEVVQASDTMASNTKQNSTHTLNDAVNDEKTSTATEIIVKKPPPPRPPVRTLTYKVIGDREIAVPTHLFKAVIAERPIGDGDEKERYFAAFVVPNAPIPGHIPITDFQVRTLQVHILMLTLCNQYEFNFEGILINLGTLGRIPMAS